MPDLYAIGEDERKRLFERDAAVLARIRNLYGGTIADINKEIAVVTGQLQALQRGEGDAKREPGLIAREIKAKQWLKQVEGRLAQLAAPAAKLTAWHQGEASKLGQEAVIRAGNRQLGTVATDWNKLQSEAAEAFVGFAGDGSPLAKVFRKIGPDTAADMEAVLFKGIGLGKNPLATGRELRQAASLSSLRAQTIARTETIRAYRETQHLTLNENTDVLEGWVWTASKSMRTCAACLAMDGTFHRTEERMKGHPNCRCVAVPLTKGIDEVTGRKGLGETRVELGETGTEWFKKQDAETQNFVLGPRGGVEYRKGNVKLENFVAKIRDPEWGDFFTRGTLRDALKGGGSHPGYSIPPIVKKRKRAPKGLPPTNVAEPPVSIPTPAPPPAIIPGQFTSIAEAEAGMETLYPHIKFDFEGASLEVMNPNTATFHELAQEWPETAARLAYVGTLKNTSKLTPVTKQFDATYWNKHGNHNAFANWDGRVMGLNPKVYSDAAGFLSQKAYSESVGWSPLGVKGRIDATLIHEFGHLVDFWLRDEASPGIPAWHKAAKTEFKAALRKNGGLSNFDVSRYGATDQWEAFAETFCSRYVTPPHLQKPIVKALNGILANRRANPPKPPPPAPVLKPVTLPTVGRRLIEYLEDADGTTGQIFRVWEVTRIGAIGSFFMHPVTPGGVQTHLDAVKLTEDEMKFKLREGTIAHYPPLAEKTQKGPKTKP